MPPRSSTTEDISAIRKRRSATNLVNMSTTTSTTSLPDMERQDLLVQQQQPLDASFIQRTQRRRIWIGHFAISVLVLLWGTLANRQGRKYIPVETPDCSGKAFANVFSPNDLVCCTSKNVGPCISPPFPLIKRLTKFPEAWTLPLFPFLGRWLVGHSLQRPWRRLAFYTTLMMVRLVVLYMGLNQVEGLFRGQSHTDCWYFAFKQSCGSSSFDFSDHVVLFYGQVLPLLVHEGSWWWTTLHGSKMWVLIPTIYLYTVTLTSAYRTAAYFHTPAEVWAGWLVSAILPVGLCVLWGRERR